LHEGVLQRERRSVQVQRDFSGTPSGMPVSTLWPWVIGPEYENRLLDRLPVAPTDLPVTTYIRHVSTTGSPAVTAPGALKPELKFVTDYITETASKIAAHTAVTDEDIQDFGEFTNYCHQELIRQLVNEENRQLIAGAGAGTTTTELTGFLNTPSILTHVLGTGTTPETPLDGIELSISALRVGAQLAEANLCVMNPSSWSAVRRSKDSLGRYMTSPDPTADEASSVWGVDVMVTTQCPAGTALLLDTTRFGRVLVRQPMNIRVGWTEDDFVRNLTRTVAEERLVLSVERPQAVLKITGLPTS
jgi:HK97 family phage major capsid protein